MCFISSLLLFLSLTLFLTKWTYCDSLIKVCLYCWFYWLLFILACFHFSCLMWISPELSTPYFMYSSFHFYCCPILHLSSFFLLPLTLFFLFSGSLFLYLCYTFWFDRQGLHAYHYSLFSIFWNTWDPVFKKKLKTLKYFCVNEMF